MIISVTEGTIVGFESDFGHSGLDLKVRTTAIDCGEVIPLVYGFPFNENRPKSFVLEDYSFKRVRITVETIEK